MRPEACQALAELIQEYGKSIVRMPSSCQMYMAVKLANYRDELVLLSDSLRWGIPEQILQHAGTDEYEAQLARLGEEFAAARGLDRAVAAETVTAWATALNRPPGYRPAAVPDRLYPDEHKPDPAKEKTAQMLMALIAGAGGFLGTALGAGLAGLALLITDAAVGDPRAATQMGEARPAPFAVIAFAILIKMGIAGCASGVAATLGWLWGKGDAKPWAGFAAAFGTGFGLALIFLSFSDSLIRMAIIAGSVFGAAFTTASRGGRFR
jgi:hypothetical protein